MEQKSHIPALFCSGYTDRDKQWKEIVTGDFNFLHKPYALYDLLLAVHKTINPDKGK